MIRLYIADVSGLDIDAALTQVSPYRREKALRCRDDLHRRQSLGAELLLYRALGADQPITYSLGNNGKPYSEELPCFSLAHSGKYAVCAVADRAVGVDIELPRDNSLRLAERFFTKSEAERIAQSPEPDELFCEYWVRKESYLKALGDGLQTPLNSFEAAEVIGAYRTRHLVYDGYHLAVCTEGNKAEDITIFHEKI